MKKFLKALTILSFSLLSLANISLTAQATPVNQEIVISPRTIVADGNYTSSSGSLNTQFSVFGNKQYDFRFTIANNGTNVIRWTITDGRGYANASGRLNPGREYTSSIPKEALVDGKYTLNVINDDGSKINIYFRGNILD